MGLFEFFSKITHPAKRNGWVETEAVFTGKCERAAKGKPGRYTSAAYNEYQVRYYAEDGERLEWYDFYPLPDPDPESIKDSSIRIRYNKKKPWIFEAIEEGMDE
jgi:hypothetical protein